MSNISNSNFSIELPLINPISIKDIITPIYFNNYLRKRTISINILKEINNKKINLANSIMKNITNKKTKIKFSTKQKLIDILNLFY